MKTHSTNYLNTFIETAADCPATAGETPPDKGTAKSVARMQFELLSKHPYRFTSDDVLFQVYADRQDIIESDREEARMHFFSTGQPCFRASPLTKRYGWGIHFDADGKMALYGCQTPEYKALAGDTSLKKVRAMKSSAK